MVSTMYMLVVEQIILFIDFSSYLRSCGNAGDSSCPCLACNYLACALAPPQLHDLASDQSLADASLVHDLAVRVFSVDTSFRALKFTI